MRKSASLRHLIVFVVLLNIDSSSQNDGPITDSDTAYKQYTIDILFVVDYAIYNRWYLMSEESTDEARRDDAIRGIRHYYKHIANGMNRRFSEMNDTQFGVRIHLVGIHIATTAADSPWTEGPTTKQVINGTTYTVSPAALGVFLTWINNDSLGLPSCDQATLFTGHNVMNGIRNGQVSVIAGLGHVESVCTRRRVTVIQDWGEFSTIGTATHELAHNLGAHHDGNRNPCNSSSQYIMATAPSALEAHNVLNPFRFSNCSVESFRTYINKLNTQRTNCLLNATTDWDRTLSDINTTLPLGYSLTADRQCQLIFGPQSFYCGGAIHDSALCMWLHCYTRDRRCVANRVGQRAADGTTCGNHKWCIDGNCVADQRAPAANDTCLSGDLKVPFDDDRNCSVKISSNPALCYQQRIGRICCRSCELVREQRGSQDCEFGDRHVEQCLTRITAGWDCYNTQHRHTCCGTCARLRVHLPGCEYGDKLSTCRNVTVDRCNDTSISQQCCLLCSSPDTSTPEPSSTSTTISTSSTNPPVDSVEREIATDDTRPINVLASSAVIHSRQPSSLRAALLLLWAAHVASLSRTPFTQLYR